MRRLFWRFAIAVVLLIVGGYFALQAYLNSDQAKSQVAQRIATVLGTKVGVGGLEVGAENCAVANLQIFETDSSSTDPFLVINRAESDLSLVEIIRGEAEPKQLTLHEARLVLRHGADGALLTSLPKPKATDKPMPVIHIKNGSITIQAIGEPDCTFCGIDAQITNENGKVVLNGNLSDATWGGSWQIQGSVPRIGGQGILKLKNAGLHVTQAMLERVPYVPANVWQNVRLEGDTPVDVLLALGPGKEKLYYRVDLSPINTSVFVSSINLSAAMARGGVTVENKRVLLKNVSGKVADGTLSLASADLDFRPANSIMHFKLAAEKLKLQGLPAKWKLPPRLGGLLSGKADLTVHVINGHAVPSGNGEGEVENAMLGPIPVPNYGLKIQADNNGFRFEPRISDKLVIPLLRSATGP